MGSGRPSMRAFKTRWYNSAAGESYFVRITASIDDDAAEDNEPLWVVVVVVVVLGTETPCVRRKSLHWALPPAFMSCN